LLIVESDPGALLDRFAKLIAERPVRLFDSKVT